MSKDIAEYIERRDAKDQKRDEQLRELLSHCRTEAEKFDADGDLGAIDEFNPYDDVAYRLTEILDGEK